MIQCEFRKLATLLIKTTYVSLKDYIYNMKRLTTVELVKIVEVFYRNYNSVKTEYKLLLEDYGQINLPFWVNNSQHVQEFGKTGSIEIG